MSKSKNADKEAKVTKTKVNRKHKGFTISKKIMLSIIATNLIVVLMIAGIMGYTLNKNIGEISKETAVNQVKANVNKFQQQFDSIQVAVQVIATDIGSRIDIERAKTDPEYIKQFRLDMIKELQAIGKGTSLSPSVYAYLSIDLFGDEYDMWVLNDGAGNYVLQPPLGIDYYKDYNEWYDEPVKNGKTIWSFPYESAAGGLISSHVAPIMKDGKPIGVAGMDFYLDDIEKVLDEVKLFDTGYLYLIHPDGRVIVNKRMEFGSSMLDNGNYAGLLKEIGANDSGFTTYVRDDGVKVISAFSHLDNGWIVASSIPESEVLKSLYYIFTVMAAIAFLAIVISLFVAAVVGKSISKPILEVVDATEKIRDGDFTVRVDSHSKDETKLLSESLNNMVTNVKNLITEVRDVSIDMVDAASNLASMAEETSATASQVEHTVGEIASGTNDTAKDAESSAIVASNIDDKFKTLNSSSAQMKVDAEEAIKVNNAGIEALKLLSEKSDISKASNENVSVAVGRLDEGTKAISAIIDTITSISEQTNLLALNASIEAARAGEAGRGFAVVADEIRKLAESSANAANEIKTIVSNIQRDSSDTVKIINDVTHINIEQNEAVENVNDALGIIFTSVDSIAKQIDLVTDQLVHLNEDKNEIISAINNISAVTEETAASTEEVTASMAQQTTAIDEVANSANRLNELSAKLNEQINVFKVD